MLDAFFSVKSMPKSAYYISKCYLYQVGL